MTTIQVEIGGATYALPETVVRRYADGKLKPNHEQPPADVMKQGEYQRQRIMDLADECGAVDLLILQGELGISQNSITRHLEKLEKAGALERHKPEKRGTGNFTTWSRPA